MTDGFIYCDCCGCEKVAQIVGDTLVIKQKRHGRIHVAVIKLSDILDILEKRSHNIPKDQAAPIAAKT